MACRSRRIDSGDGKAPKAYHPLSIRPLTPKTPLEIDVDVGDAVLGTKGLIVYAQGLESVCGRDLGMGLRIRLSSRPATEALDLDRGRVTQGSSTSALELKARTVILLGLETASLIYPQAQRAAP